MRCVVLTKRSKSTLFGLMLAIGIPASGQTDQPMPLCQQNGAIYAPSVEMAKGNKHILMMGFKHDGPAGYFTRELQAMKGWIDQASTKVTILTELYSCQSDSPGTITVVDGAQISVDQIEKLSTGLNEGESFVEGILGDSVAKSRCQKDVDGRSYRPAFVVQRNQTLCFDPSIGDPAYGLTCQWKMDLPRGRNIVVRSGDLKLDKLPAASQAYAAFGYSSDHLNIQEPQNPKWAKAISDFND